MAFYQQFVSLKQELERMGHFVIIPDLEFENDDQSSLAGTFFDRNGGVDAFPPNHEVWKKKGKAISTHLRKIDGSDCILVTNYEKKGMQHYIGGNTFLEMGYAYGRGKNVYVLNELPEASPYKEEILGMQPIVLFGDISKIG